MSKSRRSRSRSIRKSCHTFKSGRVTRNPFLNFLRDFRKANSNMKLTELTRRGAEVWRKMNNRQRSPYCHLARQAPRRRGKRRGRRRKSRRRRRRRRSMSYVSQERDRDHGHERERKMDRCREDEDDSRCEDRVNPVKEGGNGHGENNTIEID